MSRIIIFIIILLFGFTEKLFPEIVDEYGQSCLHGNVDGCYQLGIAYRDGIGVVKNTVEAKEFFGIACDLGSTQACSELNSKIVNRPENSTRRQSRYSNARFGFLLVYPADLFVTKVLSDNGDGITLYNDDRSLELRAYGSWYGNRIKKIYQDEIKWAKESGKKVTYKVLRKRWFVFSGIDKGKYKIFYQKTFFRDGKIVSFRIEYPVRDKEKYNALISTINKNFRAQ